MYYYTHKKMVLSSTKYINQSIPIQDSFESHTGKHSVDIFSRQVGYIMYVSHT